MGLVCLPTWMVDFYGKCRQIYHTWILWVNLSKLTNWFFGWRIDLFELLTWQKCWIESRGFEGREHGLLTFREPKPTVGRGMCHLSRSRLDIQFFGNKKEGEQLDDTKVAQLRQSLVSFLDSDLYAPKFWLHITTTHCSHLTTKWIQMDV